MTLPRETRDTWWLLALIGWTVAPHLWRHPPWLALLCGGVIAWRAWLAWRMAPLPGRGTLALTLAVCVLLVARQGQPWLSRDASVTLLVVLISLKTLELRARRDALLLFFLGFFLILTEFMYSQSWTTALAMGLAVWGWLAALTLSNMPVGRPSLREAATLAARTTLVGAPIMVGLFLLFPRVPPLWVLPADAGRTGLSSTLALGDVAELALDDSIAMRLTFKGPPVPAARRYLRGPVLSAYDGEHWQVAPDGAPVPPSPPDSPWRQVGAGVDYQLTVEPLRVPWLPLLEVTPSPPEGLPANVAGGLVEDASGAWRLASPLTEMIRLQARAWPDAQRDPQSLTPSALRMALWVPERRHPRTRAWVAALRHRPDLRQAGAAEWSQAVLHHIATQGFAYTLHPGPADGDPIDSFWLDRRRGFCEHYAAAYVVIMRLLGVPARIVTGYQGGDINPVDGTLVVRQSNAHAWAEIWQPGSGWQRVDPTAAVAPDRIERNAALRPPAGLVASTLDAMSPTMRLRLRQWLESLDNRWNQWVLGYGQQRQLDLLERLGWTQPDLSSLAQALAVALSVAAFIAALWAAWQARRRSPWQRLQQSVHQELARLDVEAPAHLAPAQWAERVLARHGAAAQPLADHLMVLQHWRYGPTDVSEARRMRDRWRTWGGRMRQLSRALQRLRRSTPR